jgi:capsular polysaccharide biosynthesis protein
MSEYPPVEEPMSGTGGESQPSRRYMGQFVSLHYVFKAFSRRKWLWITMAVAGLLIGSSLHAVIPSKYTAQSELLIVSNPNDDPTRDMATDVALLQSESVAQLVITQLHLDTTAQKLTGDYTGVALTDQILQITFSAPTAADAVTRANALDNAFLNYRKAVLTEQNNAVTNTLNQQAKIATSLANLPGTTAPQKQSYLSQVNSYNQTIQSNDLTLDQIVGQSQVVAGATAIIHSKTKVFLVDGASGLVAGLGLGLGIIAVAAIVSDRIRRRDEVASALGAPVELSVGKFRRLKVMRKRRIRRRLSNPVRPVELMSRQLRAVVQAGPSPKRLAVVSVDSLEASALSLAILAGRLAVFEGSRVMVVDLSPGRILGELLGVNKPETRIVFVKGAWVPVLVSVPTEDDTIVDMPAADIDSEDLPGPAWTTPQVVLVLTTLDPGIGAGHLAAIADEAVVVVTAGRSNAPTVHATGEMLRAAGLSVQGGILIGADRNDDSLGYSVSRRRPRRRPRRRDGDYEDLTDSSILSAGAAESY